MFLFDPLGGYLHCGRVPGATIVDRWGVTVTWPENHPGSMPVVNDETKVLKDITHFPAPTPAALSVLCPAVHLIGLCKDILQFRLQVLVLHYQQRVLNQT